MLFKVLVVFLPWFLKRYIYINYYKYEIGVNSYIGFSYVFPVKLILQDGARIGHLNVIKSLEKVTLGVNSIISNLNWITSHPKSDTKFFRNYKSRNPSLELGEHSAITSRHLLDCTDLIKIGKFTTIAGFHSQILTHSIDMYKNEQSCKAVLIGDYCFVGTNSVLLPGSKVNDFIVIGAKSLVVNMLDESYSLYAGVPASKIKKLQGCNYFERTLGEVV